MNKYINKKRRKKRKEKKSEKIFNKTFLICRTQKKKRKKKVAYYLPLVVCTDQMALIQNNHFQWLNPFLFCFVICSILLGVLH